MLTARAEPDDTLAETRLLEENAALRQRLEAMETRLAALGA